MILYVQLSIRILTESFYFLSCYTEIESILTKENLIPKQQLSDVREFWLFPYKRKRQNWLIE